MRLRSCWSNFHCTYDDDIVREKEGCVFENNAPPFFVKTLEKDIKQIVFSAIIV